MQYLAPDALARARRVRLVIFDVDGVLTDGRLWYGPGGEELKAFHAFDGHGVHLLRMARLDTPKVRQRAEFQKWIVHRSILADARRDPATGDILRPCPTKHLISSASAAAAAASPAHSARPSSAPRRRLSNHIAWEGPV